MFGLTQKDEQGNWCLKGLAWKQLRVGQVITPEVSEKLYGALWKLMEYEDTGLSPEEVEHLNTFDGSQAIQAMELLQEERRKHQWISVEERLPDTEELVLVQIRHNYCTDDWWAIKESAYVTNHWYGIGNLCEVVAWRPRPEPYRTDTVQEARAESVKRRPM